MSFGGQPLEVYDRVDDDRGYDDISFLVEGCLIKTMWGVEDPDGKNIAIFLNKSEAVRYAKLIGKPADKIVKKVDGSEDIPF